MTHSADQIQIETDSVVEIIGLHIKTASQVCSDYMNQLYSYQSVFIIPEGSTNAMNNMKKTTIKLH